ncbi:AAA family ATPase [Tenacibaculum sp.]|uniref:AAA family ATPase n=1 Tax=Tenacibaculum sp. TaxID=1906242 RepID=UPI003D0B0133
MRLKLQNIGIVSSADINIDGITLITGENDSGKSTIGKTLYSIIRSFNSVEESFNDSKLSFISKKIDEISSILVRGKVRSEADSKILNKAISQNLDLFIGKKNDTDTTIQNLRKLYNSLKTYSNNTLKENILKTINEIEEREGISIDSTQFMSFELSEYFNLEFGNHTSNYFNKKKSLIELKTSIDNIVINIRENMISLEKMPINFPYKDVIFIESPLFLDKKRKSFNFTDLRNKNNYLNYKINQEPFSKDIFSSNIKDIKILNNIIKEIIGGNFSYNDKNEIIFNKKGKSFSLNNVATGLKTFGAIQLLIDNNNLNVDTLLVIDEPEVHLHPTWQVKFAEILILLSKEFAIPMVLTSHSPYFIEALEAYSAKHNYRDSTDFYFAQKDKKGESSRIINVNNDLNVVLDSISEAYYTLQDIRNDL